MSSFLRVDQRWARLGLPAEIESRLSLGQSAVVIAGLSALSWAVLFAIVVVLRAVL